MSLTPLDNLPLSQVRFARPTNQLERVVEFYSHGIGLPEIGRFEGHDGYDGVMLGLPGHSYHLEFTQHRDGCPAPAPNPDHLLVLYIPDEKAIDQIVQRLGAMGYPPVPPENPYWKALGVTIEDPDGWRVVLMNSPGFSTTRT
ncbi:MAG: VOC family protein [Gemmatimonadetes bacterium]|nr:MAG: VOC family protein [Gemmatimonadota bacterium]